MPNDTDLAREFLGLTESEAAASGTRRRPPASMQDLARDYLSMELPPPTPTTPEEPWISKAGRFFTEGIPAAARAGVESQTAPTYGQELYRRARQPEPVFGAPPEEPSFTRRVLTGGVSPIPHVLDVAEKVMRSPFSLGRAAAELGPEKAKPLTEAIVSNAPFLGSALVPQWLRSLWSRRSAAPAGVTIAPDVPPGPVRGELPPYIDFERVPPAGQTRRQLPPAPSPRLRELAPPEGEVVEGVPRGARTVPIRDVTGEVTLGPRGTEGFDITERGPVVSAGRPGQRALPGRVDPQGELPPYIDFEIVKKEGQLEGVPPERPGAPQRPLFEPPGTKVAPVTWAHWQEFRGQRYDNWHLTEDIPGHPKDSTLSRRQLESEGYTVPAPPAEGVARATGTPSPLEADRTPPGEAPGRAPSPEPGQGQTAAEPPPGGAGGAAVGLPGYITESRGRWFSPDPRRARSHGDQVSFVDVPREVAEATKGDLSRANENVLPDVWRDRARPISEAGPVPEGHVRLFRGETRYERTPIGDQAVIPGTPGRELPNAPLRPTEGQRDVGGTPLFKQLEPPGSEQRPLGEEPRRPVERAPAPVLEGNEPPGAPDTSTAGTAGRFLRDRLDDLTNEEGRLDLGKMVDQWRRFRRRFPMEEAVRGVRPDSPVISEVERFSAGLSDRLSRFAKTPVWKALQRTSPEAYKDLEEQMVSVWRVGGSTPASRATAISQAPAEVQSYMRFRERRLHAQERAARDYFGLDPVPETPEPYLPRRTDAEARESVSLGGGKLGLGRDIQSTVRSFQQERVFETTREGEAAGIKYEDPRNAILLREWESFKLQGTADLFKKLEGEVLFRDRAGAAAASPTGKPWRVERAPGGGTWWATTEQEARFLEQNLTEPQSGSLRSFVHFGNALFRNPNLFNPLPHITKNMGAKYLLARGPVGMAQLPRDVVEYARNSNPGLISRFKEAMPFSETGETSSTVLNTELHKGAIGDALTKVHQALGFINKGSSKVIFKWADPAMRYSLWKHYVGQGMGDMEAANNAWTDLIRYGTRSEVTDFWKSIPLNFFVPWRFGTFMSLAKQVRNHPVRTAMFVGGVDYLREMRYRHDGKWTHLPWDYVENPIAIAVQNRDLKEIAAIAGTTALFGPGGAFAAGQLVDTLNDVRGRGEWGRVKNMFWGISQAYSLHDEWKRFNETGDVKYLADMMATVAVAEHSALNYEPRRLMRDLPESLPGMAKSPRVEAAEAEHQRRQAAAERRKAHPPRPRQTIEEKLDARGIR